MRNLRELDHLRRTDATALRLVGLGNELGGWFMVRSCVDKARLNVIATALHHGWDHVSVSHPYRIPLREEMCQIKALFFEPEEAVMQLHPPESTYVNNHPRCLHLWRPIGATVPLPPPEMVGIKELGVLK